MYKTRAFATKKKSLKLSCENVHHAIFTFAYRHLLAWCPASLIEQQLLVLQLFGWWYPQLSPWETELQPLLRSVPLVSLPQAWCVLTVLALAIPAWRRRLRNSVILALCKTHPAYALPMANWLAEIENALVVLFQQTNIDHFSFACYKIAIVVAASPWLPLWLMYQSLSWLAQCSRLCLWFWQSLLLWQRQCEFRFRALSASKYCLLCLINTVCI